MGKIFEPQFSTRSTGTGLGLAIVRKLVESWGGTVTAEVDRGEGTVIRLQLQPWTPPERVTGGNGPRSEKEALHAGELDSGDPGLDDAP